MADYDARFIGNSMPSVDCKISIRPSNPYTEDPVNHWAHDTLGDIVPKGWTIKTSEFQDYDTTRWWLLAISENNRVGVGQLKVIYEAWRAAQAAELGETMETVDKLSLEGLAMHGYTEENLPDRVVAELLVVVELPEVSHNDMIVVIDEFFGVKNTGMKEIDPGVFALWGSFTNSVGRVLYFTEKLEEHLNVAREPVVSCYITEPRGTLDRTHG